MPNLRFGQYFISATSVSDGHGGPSVAEATDGEKRLTVAKRLGTNRVFFTGIDGLVVPNLRFFRTIKEKFFPVQTTKQYFLATVGLILIPVITISILIPFASLRSREAYRSGQLYLVSSLMNRRLASSFDEILARNGAINIPVEEQVKILNQELQPIIQEISLYNPEIGLGYYSKNLDRALAVGPDFHSEQLRTIPHEYPYFRVFETGQPELTDSIHSFFRNGEPILNLTYPINRNGQIIGYTWANVKVADIYEEMRIEILYILLAGMFTLVISALLAKRLSRRLSSGLKSFADAIVYNTNPLGDKLLPELAPVLEIVKTHTDQVFTAFAQLQEEVAMRESAEAELLQSHDQISNILESITNAYMAIDRNWRVLDLNSEAERMVNKTRAELIGIDIRSELAVSPNFLAHYQLVMTEQKAEHFEDYSYLAGRWLEAHVYPSKNGLFVYFHDITDRKKAEEALRQSEERFFKAFNSSPSMMCIMTIHDWKITDANESFFEASGWTREEIIGCTTENLNFWASYSTVTYTRTKILAEGKFRNFEAVYLTKAGQSRTVLVSGEQFDIGNEKCALVVMTDISDHKKMEKEMLNLDRLNLLGEMAAGISHEIRNPLTTVRGFLQLLKSKPESQQHVEYFKLMIEELDRANSIITEFLAIGRNKAVKLKLQNLNTVIKALEPLIQADAVGQDKAVMFELEVIPELLLDEKEIRQIILNLSRNGLEAMQPGGILTVKTYQMEEEVILAVQDQGEGIKPELLSKLGTPFLTTKEQGTGLGLAVCYGIAHRHNARIKIETSCSGTTFQIVFPVNNMNNPEKEA